MWIRYGWQALTVLGSVLRLNSSIATSGKQSTMPEHNVDRVWSIEVIWLRGGSVWTPQSSDQLIWFQEIFSNAFFGRLKARTDITVPRIWPPVNWTAAALFPVVQAPRFKMERILQTKMTSQVLKAVEFPVDRCKYRSFQERSCTRRLSFTSHLSRYYSFQTDNDRYGRLDRRAWLW